MTGRRKAAAVLTAAALVAAAGTLAYASARVLKYTGRTSQRRAISFVLSGRVVTKLDYHLDERCPGGKRLFVHDSGFPPLAISHRRFGGHFTTTHPQIATATVSGRVTGKTVSGSVADHTEDGKTHRFCNGETTFKLTHR